MKLKTLYRRLRRKRRPKRRKLWKKRRVYRKSFELLRGGNEITVRYRVFETTLRLSLGLDDSVWITWTSPFRPVLGRRKPRWSHRPEDLLYAPGLVRQLAAEMISTGYLPWKTARQLAALESRLSVVCRLDDEASYYLPEEELDALIGLIAALWKPLLNSYRKASFGDRERHPFEKLLTLRNLVDCTERRPSSYL